jgi:peptidoglycan hydrolase-like protein with peptidoglycan-binding domain
MPAGHYAAFVPTGARNSRPFFYLGVPLLGWRLLIIAAACLLLPISSPAKTKRKPTGKQAASSRKAGGKGSAASRSRKRQSRQTWRNRQTTPTPERYRDIQQALASKGYFTGDATGVWDANSVEALRRFQRDQNLEPSGKIDSRSLIALGLGPKHDSTLTSQPVNSEQQP